MPTSAISNENNWGKPSMIILSLLVEKFCFVLNYITRLKSILFIKHDSLVYETAVNILFNYEL